MYDVLQGIRPDRQAARCPDDIWAVITSCWAHQPHTRPAIDGIVSALKACAVTARKRGIQPSSPDNPGLNIQSRYSDGHVPEGLEQLQSWVQKEMIQL